MVNGIGKPPSDIKSRLIAPPPREIKVASPAAPGGPSGIDRFSAGFTVDQLVKLFSAARLGKAIDYLRCEYKSQRFMRPLNETGIPGALILHDGKRKIIVVGDLHGNEARLDLLLQHEKFRLGLAKGEYEICFLGDLIHREDPEHLEDNAGSIRILKAVISLKSIFPGRVHLLIGNHDILFTKRAILDAIVKHWFEQGHLGIGHLLDQMGKMDLDPRLDQIMLVAKRDSQGEPIPQSIAFLLSLIEETIADGLDVREMLYHYQDYFNCCPVAMIVKGTAGATYLSHSLARKDGGVTQKELIEARRNGLFPQLVLNRQSENFGPDDIIANSRALALTANPADTYFVTGHEKRSGNWSFIPFAGRQHAIIHGNVDRSFGVVVIENGLPQRIDLPVIATPAELAA